MFFIVGIATLVLAILMGVLVYSQRQHLRLQDKERKLQQEEMRKLQHLYDKLIKDFESQRRELHNQRRALEQKEREIERLKKEYSTHLEKLEAQRKTLQQKLEELSGKSKEEIEQALRQEIENELLEYKAKKIAELSSKLEEEKERLAQSMLVEVMQNVDVDFVDELTVTRIPIKNPELKGKIIGKEGRNIRALEQAAKVDVILDEEDDSITISSFDPVRREIARIALEDLLRDGRIHPASIEKAVKNAKAKITKQLLEYGRQLAQKAGLYRAPKDLLVLLGRMKFRRSNGQNLYIHTAEVVELAGEIARMLGADEKSARIGALLHDVGKLLTSRIKKPHHHISADIARKYGFSDKIINIIESHHGDIPSRYVEGEILKIADKISTLRPGARKDTVTEYVDRIKSLEEKVLELVGDKAEEIFALKAGREIRVIVKPTAVSDEEAAILAYDIARAIEESGVFPGEVEVVVIRQTRSYAKAGKPVREVVKKHKAQQDPTGQAKAKQKA